MNAVTGANGFVGNVLVRELLAQGKSVKALVRSDREYASLKGLDASREKCDVRVIEDLIQSFQGVETVYHVAGMVSIHGWIVVEL